MTIESPMTYRDALLDLLTYLVGHLEIRSPRDENAVNALQDELAHALTKDDLATIKNRYFSLESSDLFFK